MNPKILVTVGVLVALSAGALARSALGDSAHDFSTTDGGRAPERTDDNIPAPTFEPGLLMKLQELQASRRAARRAALEDAKSWEENRSQRASAHRAQLAALWGAVVGTIDGQARLRLHAERMARLNRMLDLAEQKNDAAFVKRIRVDVERELTHHVQVMSQLQTAMGLR
ncbi:MAG TPA: hypothetical protein VER11_18205 [Polyangiaceae bacterium]|nr:hypothetical protein [Polyangiaceae bacterium]